MSFLPRTSRILHNLPRPRSRPQCQRQLLTPIRIPLRTLTNKPPTPHLDPISLHRLEATQRAHHKRRTLYSAAGFLTGMICIWITATSIDIQPNKLDSGRASSSLSTTNQIIIQNPPSSTPTPSTSQHELIPTGTTSIPTFPKHITHYATPNSPPETYQLLGLGIRTVSFLHIQVYIIGLYISQSSIPHLQNILLQTSAPNGASTLIPEEKSTLKSLLMDEQYSEEIWNEVLKDAGVSTMIRIVPTRNTDFHHLRDAWVRGLTARAQREREEFGDEGFGRSVGVFKGLFNRGTVAKGRELLLRRDEGGCLGVWCEEGKVSEKGSESGGESESERRYLGGVKDERISRGIWLGYLAGAKVSSEEARRNIIDGVMGIVERPVGSVEGQVHV